MFRQCLCRYSNCQRAMPALASRPREGLKSNPTLQGKKSAVFRNSNGWKWPAFMVTYLFALAYAAAGITYWTAAQWSILCLTRLSTDVDQERDLIITELLSWKSAAMISSALAAGLGAMSAPPIAAIILATGLALAAIFAAALFGLERAFRGYAELVRAKAGRK